MKVLIIGGAGMIGRKLGERLAKDGSLAGKAISKLTLYDVVPGAMPAGAKMPVSSLPAICRPPARPTSSSPTSPT